MRAGFQTHGRGTHTAPQPATTRVGILRSQVRESRREAVLYFYRERKSRLRAAVADAGEDALMIYAADKVAKTRELRMTDGARPVGRADPEKLEHYWASLTLIEYRLPGHPLVQQPRFELETLELLPPRPDHG